MVSQTLTNSVHCTFSIMPYRLSSWLEPKSVEGDWWADIICSKNSTQDQKVACSSHTTGRVATVYTHYILQVLHTNESDVKREIPGNLAWRSIVYSRLSLAKTVIKTSRVIQNKKSKYKIDRLTIGHPRTFLAFFSDAALSLPPWFNSDWWHLARLTRWCGEVLALATKRNRDSESTNKQSQHNYFTTIDKTLPG